MIYRKLLGEAFDALPGVLRRFHDQPVGEAYGRVRITRGDGRLRNFLADILGLPSGGSFVPVRLRVESTRDGETWIRQFGTQRLITRQSIHEELLMETTGPYRFVSRLYLERNRLVFEFVRAWLWVLPLPIWMAGRIEGTVIASETADSWEIAVSVYGPVLGLLVRYEGEVTPDWKSH